jgi:hypothetical protein
VTADTTYWRHHDGCVLCDLDTTFEDIEDELADLEPGTIERFKQVVVDRDQLGPHWEKYR